MDFNFRVISDCALENNLNNDEGHTEVDMTIAYASPAKSDLLPRMPSSRLKQNFVDFQTISDLAK